MKNSLRLRLTCIFVLLSAVIIVSVSFCSRQLLNAYFQKHLTEQQTVRIDEVKKLIAQEYENDGNWKPEELENIGINALAQGLIFVLKDAGGNTIWDATEHNSGMCAAMIERMADNMKKQYPGIRGRYMVSYETLYAGDQKIADIEIGYYGPFYLSDSEAVFIGTLNGVLIWVGIFALIFSFAVGMIFARRLSAPISDAISAARAITDGNYAVLPKPKTSVKETNDLIDTVNHMSGILKKQEELRKRLSQDMVHEIRTPLATVQGYIEAMMDGLWEPTYDRIKGCYEELQRITRMVEDVHSLSKSESPAVFKQATDVYRLIGQVIANLDSEFVAKNISVRLHGHLLVAHTDRDRLVQIVINLLSNSLKYTPSGGIVQVFLQERQGWCFEIMVEDNGAGIPQEELPFIFERFYRADSSRNRDTGGAGIGLSIVKAHVEALNGNIAVKSEPNVQTKFIITLPI